MGGRIVTAAPSTFGAASRVTPLDANHIFAWEMTGSSSPIANTGTGGSADLTAGGGGVAGLTYECVSPIGKCVRSAGNSTAYFTRDGSLSLTSTFTFEAWILVHYLGGTYTLFGHTRSGGANATVNLSAAGVLGGSVRVGSFVSLTATTNVTVSPGVWNHIALTADNTTARIYLNGEVAASGAASGSLDSAGTTPKTVFFGDPNNSNTVFNGRGCRFRISDIARSQAYLRNVYAKAIGAADYASAT